MGRRATPEVNAGSMADIAFLLLIFFLVTTTIEKDKGIARQLPPKQDEQPPVDIKEKNIFVVTVNKEDQILADNELMDIQDIRQAAISFLDNGGDGSCDYCKGEKDIDSSDNPEKAIITVKSDRETSYKTYIQVQNELVAAYNFLRNRESERLFGFEFTKVKSAIATGDFKGNEERAQAKLKEIQALFPMKLSEAEAKKSQ
jgi:biopolymer transport protein ExbD